MKIEELRGIYAARVQRYVDSVLTGKRPHCREDFLKVERFKEFLQKYEVRTEEADEVLMIGEQIVKFVDGDSPHGEPLAGKPFRWLDWQIFDIYAMFIFYHPGTNNRVVKEAFIEVARKSGKTTYVDAIALSLALKEMKDGGLPIGIVSSDLQYAGKLYDVIEANIIGWYGGSKLAAQRDGWRLLNNNQNIAAKHTNFGSTSPTAGDGGLIDIEVYSAKHEGVHSLRKKMVIIDELHLMKKGAAVHTQMRKSTANYQNGLSLTITTAAIDKNNYCYEYTEFAKRVLSKKVKDRDDLYIHIAKADENDDGYVDILDRDQWFRANPSLGEATPISRLERDAAEADNMGSETKLQFLAYALNVFQNKVSSEFNPNKFIVSDMEYNWTIEELAQMNIVWYGGIDLSLVDDLTAAALYGEYGDIGIIIPHAWAPRAEAAIKAGAQNMDIYRWEEEGFFTFSEQETNDPLLVVDWFVKMREKGFNIQEIGYDTRFVTPEVKGELAKQGFNVIKERQYTSHLSVGFRHLEDKSYNSKIYYLHSGLYEYCLNNLLVTSKRGNEVYYEKKGKNDKIDAFDASVFAAVRKIQNYDREASENELLEYLEKQLALSESLDK